MRFSRRAGLVILVVLLSISSISIVSCVSSQSAPQAEPTAAPSVEPVEQEAPEADTTEQDASSKDAGMALPILAPVAEGASADTSYSSRVTTSWVLDYMGEDDAQVALLPDTHLTLGFMLGRYGGDGGCNFYSGVFSQDGENVTLETPATTGSLCQDDPDLLKQESSFMSLLATTAAYDIVDGKLKLYSSQGQQLLTFLPMTPAKIDGAEWKLRFINAETQWEELIPGTEITLTLSGDEISGNSGCNEYGGMASITEDGYLEIGASTITNGYCEAPQGVMDQENLYLEKLVQTGLLRYFPASFELLDPNGMPLLVYSADWQDYMEQ